MTTVRCCAVLLLLLSFLVGCSAMPTPTGDLAATEPTARQLVDAAVAAQGEISSVRDVSVSYDGEWLSWVVKRVQPKLVDEAFRKSSQERYLLGGADTRLTAQLHTGDGGQKWVLRRPDSISVAYNGQGASDSEVLASAALVADAYRLFLLGPTFLMERNAVFKTAPAVTIDGRKCDQVLAILRPGIGGEPQDRVLIALDRTERRPRRIRMTLEGLESTRGAVVDVFPGDYLLVEGVWWPTTFHEALVRPFPADVHRWRLTGIDVNRGLTPDAFGQGAGYTGPASRPAGSSRDR